MKSDQVIYNKKPTKKAVKTLYDRVVLGSDKINPIEVLRFWAKHGILIPGKKTVIELAKHFGIK